MAHILCRVHVGWPIKYIAPVIFGALWKIGLERAGRAIVMKMVSWFVRIEAEK